MRNFSIKIILLFLVCAFTPSAFGQRIAVPAEYQAELIPRIIQMNKNFTSTNDTINIGIYYSSYLDLSSGAKKSIVNFFENRSHEKNNFAYRIFVIDAANIPVENLKSILMRHGISVLYIAPLRSINYSVIRDICRERKIFSISANPDLVETYFTLSFDLVNDKIKIIVNLNSARMENVNFSAYLLKVARIIDD